MHTRIIESENHAMVFGENAPGNRGIFILL